MKTIFAFSIVLIFGQNYIIFAEYLPSLRLAHVVYRHGARAPMSTYPTDPHQEDVWPGRWGALGELGVRQHYKLGQYFRKYFKGFINSPFDSRQIQVRSTDTDRTLVSAYCNLDGLYGVSEGRNALVPVHAPVPTEMDAMLHIMTNCPLLIDQLDQTHKTSPELRGYERKHEDLLSLVREKSGMGPKASTLSIGLVITDALRIEKYHNLTQPDWVIDNVFNKLEELESIQLKLFIRTFGISAGLFYQEMRHKTNLYRSGKNRNMRVYFYSAHDVTVALFLDVMGLWDEGFIEFGATLIFELHERVPGEFFIRVLYRNDTQSESEARVLKMKDCDTFCPVDRFFELTLRHTWKYSRDEFFEMCNTQTLRSTKSKRNTSHKDPTSTVSEFSSSNNVVIGVFVVLVAGVLVVLFGVAYHKLRRDKSYTLL